MRSHEMDARSWPGPISLGIWLALLLGAGCSGKLPNWIAPSSCGDRCGSFSCPPDTHCAVTGACAPTCLLNVLAPR